MSPTTIGWKRRCYRYSLQMAALADYIRAALFLRFNKRQVG